MSKESLNNIDIKKSKKVLLILIIIIIVLSGLLLISETFGNFSKVRLKTNNKTIFSISDLTVGKLKYSDSEKLVRKEMGKPKKEKKINKDIYIYKELYYDGIILTLKENYSDYMLVKVEVTSDKYMVSRKVRVNDKISKVIKKYKVENKTGTYIYGNYSIDSLGDSSIKDNIYFGIRNKKELAYVNRDAIVGDDRSNIARMNIEYKFGKVKKIIWSYDFD